MSAPDLVLALDLGTTANRALLVDHRGRVFAQAHREFPQHYPAPGWVEHDPMELWRCAQAVLNEVLREVDPERVACLGIANQRETTLLWERATGRPVANAIVWQDRRTAPMCEAFAAQCHIIRQRTGLPLDPYFSATKIRWLLDEVPGLEDRARAGEIAFGTVDSWALWQLTGGKVHATDPGNASRTLLFNLVLHGFDRELLDLFGIPAEILPEIRQSGDDFGVTEARLTGGRAIPIAGVMGDQQAALFAQGGWQPGIVKNTYGTGLFLLTATGNSPIDPGDLVATVAWELGGRTTYALEGSVFVGGAAIQWLRDGLGILPTAAAAEELARRLASNEGVYFVPALAGLGAPYWDPDARGLITGLTRGTRPEHLARAALEAIAYQTRDVVDEMAGLTGSPPNLLRVDGGATASDLLMQFQADILDIPIERPALLETTALGAAGVAGLTTGFWPDAESFLAAHRVERLFAPQMPAPERERLYAGWQQAVARTLSDTGAEGP